MDQYYITINNIAIHQKIYKIKVSHRFNQDT